MKGNKRLNQNLVKAVKQGNVEEVRRLLERGANVLARCHDGHSVLEHALFHFENKEISELLLQNGADPDVLIGCNKDIPAVLSAVAFCDGEDPYAARAVYLSSRFTKPEDRVSMLIRYGANPYLFGGRENNALYIAQESGREDLVELLVNGRAEVEKNALEMVLPVLPEVASRPRARL